MGVSIPSYTQTRFSRFRPRTRTRPSRYNTIQPKTTTGWPFASGSSWTLRHTGGSRQDTHGTPVPEGEGRGWPTTDDLRRTTVTQRHASDKRAFRKQVQTDVLSPKTGVDRHLFLTSHCYLPAQFTQKCITVRKTGQSCSGWQSNLS